MADVIFLAIMVAFFAVAVLFVRGCERIIGPDLEAARDEQAVNASEQPAA
jgi:hypothetical protein